MSKMQYDETTVRNHLAAYVAGFNSQSDAAKALGISPPYLSDLLRGNRGISEEIAAKLGYIKKEVYEYIEIEKE